VRQLISRIYRSHTAIWRDKYCRGIGHSRLLPRSLPNRVNDESRQIEHL